MTAKTKAGVPLAKLDIGMLSSLDALLSERSVSKAARKLGLSQPAMSNALARLRLAFGDPLLIRSGSEMVLTERAARMSERVEDIVHDLFLLTQQRRFDPTVSTASFQIGLTDHASLVLMPEIIARVRKEAPKVRIMTSPLDSNEDVSKSALPHLRMHWVRAAPPDWHVRKLLDEDLVVIGRKGHPDLLQPLPLERFLELEQVTLSPNEPSFHTRIDIALGKKNLKRRVVMSLVHFTTLPFVISETDLIALFPRRLLKTFKPSANFEVVDSPFAFEKFSTSMAWHPRYQHDEAHSWLRDLIVRAASTVAQG